MIDACVLSVEYIIITCTCEVIIIQFISIKADAVMGSLGVVTHLFTAVSSIATLIDVCMHIGY